MTLGDTTRAQYSYDKVSINKDGSATVRVFIYNAAGQVLENGRWIDLPLTTAQKTAIKAKVDEKMAALASEYNLTEYVELEAPEPPV